MNNFFEKSNPCVFKVLPGEPDLIRSESDPKVIRVEFNVILLDEKIQRLSVPPSVAIKIADILKKDPNTWISIHAIRHDETPEQREASRFTDAFASLFQGAEPKTDEYYNCPLKKRIEYIVEEVA